MRLILLLLGFVLATSTLSAQVKNENAKLSKKEKKEQRRKEANLKLIEIHQLLNSKKWVIHISELSNVDQVSVNLSPETNFLRVFEQEGLVQLDLSQTTLANSLDHISIDGEVISYSLSEFKENQEIECSVSIKGYQDSIIRYSLSVMSNGDVTVKITTPNSRQFTLYGVLKPQ